MSALDIPLTVTRFPDTRAQTCTRFTATLRELAGQLSSIIAPTKTELPLFKLAAFGDHRTDKGCLRNDSNVQKVSGVELDYDNGLISLNSAEQGMRAARIPGIFYTSPSHRPDAPRWRFFSPLSKTARPEERHHLVSRIAGALPPEIVLGGESWTLSQTYFVGHAEDAVDFKVVLVDGEDYLPVDLRDDLDATARAKHRPNVNPQLHLPIAGFDPGPGDDAEAPPDDSAAFDDGGPDAFDPSVAREIILNGLPGMHDAMRGFAWHLASYDLPEPEIITQLHDLYRLRPDTMRDARWQRDLQDIPRTVRSAIEKIASLRTEQNGADAQVDPNDPWAARPELDSPDPLIAPAQPQALYPLDRLPASFSEPVHAVARVAEAAPSLAGTVTLAAMATATAKIAIGVEVEAGLVFPISLYTADIVGSSERKTTAERRVYAGIHSVVNDELLPEYQLQRREYYAALAVYERDKQSILSQRARDKKAKNAAPAEEASSGFDAGSNSLAALLGLQEPAAPKLPHIVTNDFTIEGMRDALAENSGQLAVVTSEGAVLFNGYSLGDKTRRGASVGALSRYWDGLDETVTRAKGRVITIRDPRVSLSIGVQPRVASTFFADLEMRDQGIVNRFLITWPAPLAGTRKLEPPALEDLETIRQFNEQAQRCLRLAHGLTEGETSSVQPRAALTLAPAAREAWRAYAKQVERKQAKGEPYEHITGWAGKAAEQAARIAVILTLFSDPEAQVVDLTAMQAGITLASWYCDEWLRVCELVEPSPELRLATRVLEWLRATYAGKTDAQGQPVTFTARDIYSAEVAGIATRDPAEQVLQILVRHGEIETSDSPKPKKTGRPLLVRWRLTRRVCEREGSRQPAKPAKLPTD
jgi:hypothetical protein